MRFIGDLKSLFGGNPQILSVEKTPGVGVGRNINGRYVFPLFSDNGSAVNKDSYLLDGSGDIDGGDVISRAYAHLLNSNPTFDFVYFNPLLTDDHVGELSLTDTITDPSTGTAITPRLATGRGPGGPYPSGQAPNMTAILPQNNAATPARPGLLLSDVIDISGDVPGGVTRVAPFWHTLDFSVSADVQAHYGALAGNNTPAIKSVYEATPTALEVYASADGGASWKAVSRSGASVSFCDPTTSLRLAFVNRGATPIYLNTFALLF